MMKFLLQLKLINWNTNPGKSALPPILPAISKAAFTATGELIRMMPMTKQVLLRVNTDAKSSEGMSRSFSHL